MRAEDALKLVADAGVVGAGGAGFPTHVKLKCKPEVVIANCAECEPLLKVDKNVMENYPQRLIAGVRAVMDMTGAPKGYIALKEHNHKAAKILSELLEKTEDIEVFLLDNYYPAGDEQQIVYEVTGKIVPVGGIPLDVGAVVCNTCTMYNIANALEGKPVTKRFVTVNGEVNSPATFEAPIGTPLSLLISLAGGTKSGRLEEDYGLIVGGPMMGKVSTDFNAPVTKTTGGVLVFPKNHKLIKRKGTDLEIEARVARSVCCQCNQCTQLCPRNLLGLNVQPHKVMRAMAYGALDSIEDGKIVFGCCDCGLCTEYACPMGLSPSRFITAVKQGLGKKGVKPQKTYSDGVSPSREGSKVPTDRLMQRLGIAGYTSEAPLCAAPIEVHTVRVKLSQHIGAPAEAIVKEGDSVTEGSLIGRAPEGKLSANVHASISGKVTAVTPDYIEIQG